MIKSLVLCCCLLLQNIVVFSQNGQNVGWPDRHFMYPYSQNISRVSTLGTYATLALAGLPLLEKAARQQDFLNHGLMLGSSLLLTTASKELLKNAIVRHRPYSYFEEAPDLSAKHLRNSFPSGHTAYAFMGATFLATTTQSDQPYRLPLIISGYTLATATAVLRVRSGNHFLSDVAAGAALGSFCGWIIPTLLKQKTDNPATIVILPYDKGISLSISLK